MALPLRGKGKEALEWVHSSDPLRALDYVGGELQLMYQEELDKVLAIAGCINISGLCFRKEERFNEGAIAKMKRWCTQCEFRKRISHRARGHCRRIEKAISAGLDVHYNEPNVSPVLYIADLGPPSTASDAKCNSVSLYRRCCHRNGFGRPCMGKDN